MANADISELKQLVNQGLVQFLTIDTSVFKKYGLALQQGLLSQLQQFKHNRFTLVLSEVVVREIRRQIAEYHEDQLSSWPKISRRLRALHHVADEFSAMDAAISALPTGSELASYEVDQFLIATGADVISADHASMDAVLDLYFDRVAPFGNGGKRSEFPDAIALLGIEEWCRAANSGMIVVSTDGDWKRYCEQSSTGKLFVVDDLATALEIINATAAEREARALSRQERLYAKLKDGEIERVVKEQLKRLLLEQAEPLAISGHTLMSHITRVDVGGLEFSDPARVRDDEGGFVVLVDLTAKCTFWARFTFFGGDFRPNGEATYGLAQEIEASVLITSAGDTVSTEVLIKNEKLTIEFGQVEPDSDGDASHLPTLQG